MEVEGLILGGTFSSANLETPLFIQ